MKSRYEFLDRLPWVRRVSRVGQVQPPSADRFTAFCVKYFPIVTARLKRIGVRDADIKDVAQKVFLKVHQYFEQIPPEGVDPWLFKICEQQAASHYRPLRERLERPEPNADFSMVEEDNPFDRLELAQFMSQALEQMEPRLVQVLILHEIDEKPLPEIAQELGISRNTAQARLAEAKKSLKLKMEQLLRPITPPKRRLLLLLPFGLDTVFRLDKPLSPEFAQEVQRDVWQRLSCELGLPEKLPPGPLLPPDPPSEPPSSGKRITGAGAEPSPPSSKRLRDAVKPLLKRILTDPLFWSIPGMVGAYLLGRTPLPREPLSNMQMAPIVLPIVIEAKDTQGGVTNMPVPASSVHEAKARPIRGNQAPNPDIDLERKVLAQAREGLRGRRFAEVLAAMNDHTKKYPKSPYAALREGYIVQALIGLGRVEEAQRRAEALRSEHPGDEIVEAHDELVEHAVPTQSPAEQPSGTTAQ
ncbi:RNA polymerase sigma factor [Polyangium mundeleinium]|uniref:Sigma-70 family RNA polymerase sigma factor n=1 Tax=Polyangium mundeleinium TaxID=2995306 RepID=A0ABT5F7L5_9BACT|nr:sigma-70 family RNA polymerase sigma factor [Polyangium mundeleinium]MDC0749971.1 sigma-70 family RNA polymerase sigma factor [Polyangium mundeleinium]